MCQCTQSVLSLKLCLSLTSATMKLLLFARKSQVLKLVCNIMFRSLYVHFCVCTCVRACERACVCVCACVSSCACVVFVPGLIKPVQTHHAAAKATRTRHTAVKARSASEQFHAQQKARIKGRSGTIARDSASAVMDEYASNRERAICTLKQRLSVRVQQIEQRLKRDVRELKDGELQKVHMCAYTYIHTYTCIHTHTHTHTHTRTYKRPPTHTHVCARACENVTMY